MCFFFFLFFFTQLYFSSRIVISDFNVKCVIKVTNAIHVVNTFLSVKTPRLKDPRMYPGPMSVSRDPASVARELWALRL